MLAVWVFNVQFVSVPSGPFTIALIGSGDTGKSTQVVNLGNWLQRAARVTPSVSTLDVSSEDSTLMYRLNQCAGQQDGIGCDRNLCNGCEQEEDLSLLEAASLMRRKAYTQGSDVLLFEARGFKECGESVASQNTGRTPDLHEGDLTDYLEFDNFFREYKWSEAPRAVFTRMLEMELSEAKSETNLSTSEFKLMLGKSNFLRLSAHPCVAVALLVCTHHGDARDVMKESGAMISLESEAIEEGGKLVAEGTQAQLAEVREIFQSALNISLAPLPLRETGQHNVLQP
eukprot:600035-Hanusia_phi.AAC.2